MFPIRLFSAHLLFAKNCTQTQCCTSGFENDYVSCINCVGSAANITDYTVYQTTVDGAFVMSLVYFLHQSLTIPQSWSFRALLKE